MSKRDASLPADLPRVLEAELRQCRHYSVEDAKFALYSLVEVPQAELQDICAKIKGTFIQNVLQMEEWEVEDFIFLAPGWNELVQKNLGQLLEYHIQDLDKGWRNSLGSNQGKIQWFPFGFVVVTNRNWETDGLAVVYCDFNTQSQMFTVDSCRMEVKDLGVSLTSLRSGDDYFENLKNEFDIEGRLGG